ncbi:UNKNOWN [Stylonychia lemnae]|uniref:Uncharacterized protein n=1 Tax=Stylonychia lemnae TaxID=5949 RepID=A0A078ARQ8_STYLE|nr:UNKNOWN [Stylonychia lemnae]|eukprot:CDW83872.1 UNKNOWN [Stylonychia lemnae]
MQKLNFVKELCLLDNSHQDLKRLVGIMYDNQITKTQEQHETFRRFKFKQIQVHDALQNQPTLYQLAQQFKHNYLEDQQNEVKEIHAKTQEIQQVCQIQSDIKESFNKQDEAEQNTNQSNKSSDDSDHENKLGISK